MRKSGIMNYENNITHHKPVLLNEVVDFLRIKPNGIYLDATVGCGGHAERILETNVPDGKLVGIDTDPLMLDTAGKRLKIFGKRCFLIEGSYTDLKSILVSFGIEKADGILFDLGANTEHFLDPKRGFSFKESGPLDMRFSPKNNVTAEDIINDLNPEELVEILYRYGEERNAKKIVKTIVRERDKKRIKTTEDLVDIIIRNTGAGRKWGIHPATRTFQALRIAVNDELNNIALSMSLAVDALSIGGRLCVISFHSLEDRIVKNIFRSMSKEGKPLIRLITKKPVAPRKEELSDNPRSRSAKLRVVEKICG